MVMIFPVATLILASVSSVEPMTQVEIPVEPQTVIDTSDTMIQAGEPYQAVQMLRQAIQNNTKSVLLPQLQQALARALTMIGDYEEAEKLLSLPAVKKISSTPLYQANLDMANYNFTAAKANYRKAGAVKTDDIMIESSGEEGMKNASFAQEMLDGRVEKIAVVDVKFVPRDSFFKAFPMSESSGKIVDVKELNLPGAWTANMKLIGPAFVSESDDLFYVTDTDDSSTNRIYEGFSLVGGGKSEPRAIFDEDTDAAYPFLLSDGCTFYFGSRSEEGIGGYDIFRSNRDNEDGTFIAPVNMGMPYNSPFNDYMLAIDEENGFGWWVSDRNHIFDKDGNELLTVYCFVPSAVRQNYAENAENLKFFASLPVTGPGAIRETLDSATDYADVMQKIQSADSTGSNVEDDDFRIAAPDGKVYTSFSQLPRQARSPAQKYLDAKEAYEAALNNMLSQSPSTSGRNLKADEKKIEELKNAMLKALGTFEQAFY